MYDPIRHQWVKEDPEERVRQALIHQMLEHRGYPSSLLAVERSLAQLPHLSGQKLPARRLDLLCFGKDIHPDYPLYPLLMVECKAVPLTEKVRQQVAGYNHYVGAYFIAIANASEFQLGWHNGENYQFQPGLPSYDTLLAALGSPCL